MLDAITTLFVLVFLEIVLGIDNIIFISVAVSNVKKSTKIRFFGLSLALVFRLLMLFAISFVLRISKKVFFGFSYADLLFLLGGMFLFIKSILEIKSDFFPKRQKVNLGAKINIILQIAFIDLVFSFDSLVVALGITKQIHLIAIAFVITIAFMVLASDQVVKYILKFPELKMVSLVFVSVIGAVLVLYAFKIHVDKHSVYFAFLFCLVVEILNLLKRCKRKQDL